MNDEEKDRNEQPKPPPPPPPPAPRTVQEIWLGPRSDVQPDEFVGKVRESCAWTEARKQDSTRARRSMAGAEVCAGGDIGSGCSTRVVGWGWVLRCSVTQCEWNLMKTRPRSFLLRRRVEAQLLTAPSPSVADVAKNILQLNRAVGLLPSIFGQTIRHAEV